MYKRLRILCTVLSAIFLAAILPASSIFDWLGFIVCAAGAALFFLLMLFFKQSQENQESPSTPKSSNDFFHPDTNTNDNTPTSSND